MRQTSLFAFSGGNGRTLGRPRGRMVDSRFNRRAMDWLQPSSPSGAPRWTPLRSVLSSLSVRASLTRSTRLGRRSIGQGDSKFGSDAGLCSQRQSGPHRELLAVLFGGGEHGILSHEEAQESQMLETSWATCQTS